MALENFKHISLLLAIENLKKNLILALLKFMT
jgi:hypothetical protein